ncbi:HlyD family type I secretion periplasmic adaptor subunit [Methylocella sp.]|uniref:HlyD family type I secretion periplasmic adaptor subunit n=1 Tax=Methylocella sp. TaxID=1978226 RepID=UPI003783D42A
MNETPRVRTARKAFARKADDREFLPAALEILETPPSPARAAMLLVICALFAVVAAFAWWGGVDIVAVAPGRLRPAGQVKVIQPLEPGKLAAAFVENGAHVAAGAPLAMLEREETDADENAVTNDLVALKAEAERRRSAIAAARLGEGAADVAFTDDVPQSVRLRESLVFAADLSRLRSETASLSAQALQKGAERARLDATIASEKILIETLRERVAMRRELIERRAGSKASLLDAMEAVQLQETALAQQVGQRAETEASLAVIARDVDRTLRVFIAENAQKLAEAERQIVELREKLAKTRARSAHMTLRSPIAGVVHGSTLTTVGQVVGSGEEMMKIVPEDAELEIVAYLPNRDAGFVKEGQKASVKVDAFPFTRYGALDARVVRIARDASADPAGRRPAQSARLKGASGGPAENGEDPQGAVFEIVLKPDRASFAVDGADAALTSGMSVSAEIRTGRRRIVDYLFAPLMETASQAMKER